MTFTIHSRRKRGGGLAYTRTFVLAKLFDYEHMSVQGLAPMLREDLLVRKLNGKLGIFLRFPGTNSAANIREAMAPFRG